jgi:hypothetical protein
MAKIIMLRVLLLVLGFASSLSFSFPGSHRDVRSVEFPPPVTFKKPLIRAVIPALVTLSPLVAIAEEVSKYILIY